MSLEWILLGFRILATVILYTFLGVAFYLIWHDLKQVEDRSESRRGTEEHLADSEQQKSRSRF